MWHFRTEETWIRCFRIWYSVFRIFSIQDFALIEEAERSNQAIKFENIPIIHSRKHELCLQNIKWNYSRLVCVTGEVTWISPLLTMSKKESRQPLKNGNKIIWTLCGVVKWISVKKNETRKKRGRKRSVKRCGKCELMTNKLQKSDAVRECCTKRFYETQKDGSTLMLYTMCIKVWT